VKRKKQAIAEVLNEIRRKNGSSVKHKHLKSSLRSDIALKRFGFMAE
jgi:hypothetical protein